MIDQVARFTLPAAYTLLPAVMDSPEASAMVLAIGLQESRFLARRQLPGGPARGFWQFEIGGVRGVVEHADTGPALALALEALCYAGAGPHVCLDLIENNDTLAAVFARLLLWTLPGALPGPSEGRAAWEQYCAAWHPGKPIFASWLACYTEAWKHVDLAHSRDRRRAPR